VARYPLIAFFKGKRDGDIHVEPVEPRMSAAVKAEANLRFSASLGSVHTDPHGEIRECRELGQAADPEASPKQTVEIGYIYYFSGARDRGDVISLCRSYLNDLRALIENGIAHGMITA
jgi:hypothetical protein